MLNIIVTLFVISLSVIIYILIKSKKRKAIKISDNNALGLSLNGTFEYNSYPYASNTDNFKFMASIRGASYRINNNNRSGIDLLCIIDKSGSMKTDNRMKLVKYTVNVIINTFLQHKNDRLSIITFSNSSQILLPLIPINKSAKNKKKALNIINEMYCDGSTALCDGLIEGIKLMKSNNNNSSNSNLVRSIFLFTDGEANIGKTSNEDIIHELTKIKQGMNCTINTFGCGNNHNANLLQSIAEQGNNGMYSFILEEKIIAKTLAECIGGLMGIIAQNIRINIECFNEGICIQNILSKGYKYKIVETYEGTNNLKHIIFNINDLQSEENRDLLFELKIPKINQINESYNVIKLTVDYINVIRDKKEKLSKICCICRSKNGNDDYKDNKGNINLDIQFNRLKTANGMKEADKYANNGNLIKAKDILKSLQISIKKSISGKNRFCQNLIKDINVCLENMENESKYKNDGNKMLKMNCKAHLMQRSCQSTKWQSQNAYRTTVKGACIDEVD